MSSSANIASATENNSNELVIVKPDEDTSLAITSVPTIGHRSLMTVEDAILKRRSVRGYLSTPVADELLTHIFQLAQQTPSNCNIQPWRVFVASGATRDVLKQRMVDRALKGDPIEPDYEILPKFEGVYRDRQFACAYELYKNMGIERHDKVGRQHAVLRNFELFDAPHVCFIGMEQNFGISVALDIGMYSQNLMSLMTAHGIGSCAQGAMRYYPNDVRAVFGIDRSISILLGISFGYEDITVAANRTRTVRASLVESVVFKT